MYHKRATFSGNGLRITPIHFVPIHTAPIYVVLSASFCAKDLLKAAWCHFDPGCEQTGLRILPELGDPSRKKTRSGRRRWGRRGSGLHGAGLCPLAVYFMPSTHPILAQFYLAVQDPGLNCGKRRNFYSLVALVPESQVFPF
ncbi:hypothetical protein Lsha_2143 [Legionella shakespearei DSM 23087]|uniref:Uncharacterized protein n=1 Tax=Legionella shakespearei DSM 23087 TaxID=1122169 RepID=A0A0W0YLR6_9GAMM|nr:hypothetical protein Lsha_2143 [Legionella shakespearei DSM 23087]